MTGVTEWHINADEVNVLDYNDDIQDPGEASFERKSNALPIYEPNGFRSSDHDPLVIGLVCDGGFRRLVDVSVTPSELWAPNGKYRDVVAVVSVDDADPNSDGDPPLGDLERAGFGRPGRQAQRHRDRR